MRVLSDAAVRFLLYCFSILRRRNTIHLPELLSEIAWMIKAAANTDFRKAAVRIS